MLDLEVFCVVEIRERSEKIKNRMVGLWVVLICWRCDHRSDDLVGRRLKMK